MKVEIPSVDGNPELIAAQISEELHDESPEVVYARISLLQFALNEVLKKNRKKALESTDGDPKTFRHGSMQVVEKTTYDYSGDTLLKTLTSQVAERRDLLRRLETTPKTIKKELKWTRIKK